MLKICAAYVAHMEKSHLDAQPADKATSRCNDFKRDANCERASTNKKQQEENASPKALEQDAVRKSKEGTDISVYHNVDLEILGVLPMQRLDNEFDLISAIDDGVYLYRWAFNLRVNPLAETVRKMPVVF